METFIRLVKSLRVIDKILEEHTVEITDEKFNIINELSEIKLSAKLRYCRDFR